MKNFTLIVLLSFFTTTIFSQEYSTGVITFETGVYDAKIDVNATTDIVTLTLNGPFDRYFALAFNATGMGSAGADCVMYLGTAGTGTNVLSDRALTGNFGAPSLDAGATGQNWNVTSNVVSGTNRTIVATRARVSSGDYTFPNTATPINLIWSRKETADYVLNYHGATRGSVVSNLTLGNNEFEKQSFKMYPNPSKLFITIEMPVVVTTKGELKIYDSLGRVVIKQNITELNTRINTSELSSGSYIVVIRTEYGNSTNNLIIN